MRRAEAGRGAQEHEVGGVDGFLVGVKAMENALGGEIDAVAELLFEGLGSLFGVVLEGIGDGDELGAGAAKRLCGGSGAATTAADEGDLDSVVGFISDSFTGETLTVFLPICTAHIPRRSFHGFPLAKEGCFPPLFRHEILLAAASDLCRARRGGGWGRRIILPREDLRDHTRHSHASCVHAGKLISAHMSRP
jgi:hypothetical protein